MDVGTQLAEKRGGGCRGRAVGTVNGHAKSLGAVEYGATQMVDIIGHITSEQSGVTLVTPDGEAIALKAPAFDR